MLLCMNFMSWPELCKVALTVALYPVDMKEGVASPHSVPSRCCTASSAEMTSACLCPSFSRHRDIIHMKYIYDILSFPEQSSDTSAAMQDVVDTVM